MATCTCQETGLGEVDNRAINAELLKLSGKKKKKPQSKYTDEDRYTIAKYAKDHGASRAADHFKAKYPTISESTVRGFVSKFNNTVKAARRTGEPLEKKLRLSVRGRPLMLGPVLDEKVKKFIISLYRKGGHVSRSIAATTANVLRQRSDDESLKNLVVSDVWGKSFLKRLGFRRRATTTSKVEIPESAKKEAGLQFHYRITSAVVKNDIPPSLVLNSDQTPTKYVQVGRFTMAPKGTKKVGVAGSGDKRTITLTIAVSLDGNILPFQIIYKGATKQSIPKVRFPDGFSLSANIKHHSNTEEVLKQLKEIIIPYFNAERVRLGKPDQYALMIWDVFPGQCTEPVKSLMAEHNILYEYVPNNMTDVFQPLDLTVNKWVKSKVQSKFNAWYRDILNNELDTGKSLDEINIKFLLTTMKPLHAGWLIDIYNNLSSSEGKSVILNGWKGSGITPALEKGLRGFTGEHMDPFYDLDPYDQGDVPISYGETSSAEYVDPERVEGDDDDDDHCGEYLPGVEVDSSPDGDFEDIE